jgi:hypothetical protein
VWSLCFYERTQSHDPIRIESRDCQTDGRAVTEIARRGFTILAELPQDDDDEPLPGKVVARKADD